MRLLPLLATALLFGLTACASSGTGTSGDGTSDRTVETETVGDTRITVESDRPVDVYHHHYPTPVSRAPYRYGTPPREYHTHTGSAMGPRPQPRRIDYGPPPTSTRYYEKGAPAPRPRHYGSYHYSGRPHMSRSPAWGDYHNQQPYPRPDNAGIGPAEIAEAQHNLAQLGYYPGPIDGLYGPLTRRAVIAYTRHQGMPTDGRVTHSLLTYLRNDLNERIRPPSVNEQHGPYYN